MLVVTQSFSFNDNHGFCSSKFLWDEFIIPHRKFFQMKYKVKKVFWNTKFSNNAIWPYLKSEGFLTSAYLHCGDFMFEKFVERKADFDPHASNIVFQCGDVGVLKIHNACNNCDYDIIYNVTRWFNEKYYDSCFGFLEGSLSIFVILLVGVLISSCLIKCV